MQTTQPEEVLSPFDENTQTTRDELLLHDPADDTICDSCQ